MGPLAVPALLRPVMGLDEVGLLLLLLIQVFIILLLSKSFMMLSRDDSFKSFSPGAEVGLDVESPKSVDDRFRTLDCEEEVKGGKT